jgi:hypothetical protein
LALIGQSSIHLCLNYSNCRVAIVGGYHLSQCATMNLNKRSLPKPTTTTGWKLIPHRSKISMNWNPLHWDPIIKYFFKVFFRLTIFFFQEQKKFVQGTTFVQFFMYCKAKKNFGVIRNFLKFFDFQKSLIKLGPTVEDFNSSWFWLLRGSPFTLW